MPARDAAKDHRSATATAQDVALRYSLGEARYLLKTLGRWYAKNHRKLPFRENVNWYKTLVSEIMLQQTRVAAMLPAFERFMKRFPGPEALARAAEEDVLHHWAGLGYYNRARNLQKCASQILEHHNGQFPSDRKEALALAGVGPYTAAAVRSIAMDIADPVIDGNVVRVLNRIFYDNSGATGGPAHRDSVSGGKPANESPKRDRQKKANGIQDIWEERNQKALNKPDRSFPPLYAYGSDETKAAGEMAMALMECSPLEPSVHNQALMELGAMVCTPGLPSCLVCPIRNGCSAFAAGGPEFAAAIPQIKKTPKQDLQLEVYWLDANDSMIIVKNPSRPLFKKDWFLPCRIHGEAGLIYSDFDESRFSDSIGELRERNDAEVSEDKRSNRKETALSDPSTKQFRHSIMQYRIQGTVRYLSLDGNRVERLLKASSGSGAGADRGTILASEKSSAYGGESSRQGADIGAEVMAI